jgi:hypothetical protein
MDYLGDARVDGRIILKSTLEKLSANVSIGFNVNNLSSWYQGSFLEVKAAGA